MTRDKYLEEYKNSNKEWLLESIWQLHKQCTKESLRADKAEIEIENLKDSIKNYSSEYDHMKEAYNTNPKTKLANAISDFVESEVNRLVEERLSNLEYKVDGPDKSGCYY